MVKIMNPDKDLQRDDQRVIFTFGNDGLNSTIVNSKRCNFNALKKILNILYKILVLCILLWPFILSIVEAAQKKNIQYFTANLFTSLGVLQFIFGIYYYNKDHYTKSVKRNSEYYTWIYGSHIVAILLSVVIAILSVILLVKNKNLLMFEEIWFELKIGSKVIFCIAIFINKFYECFVIFTNIVTFSSIFILHSIEIKKFKILIEKFLDKEQNVIFDNIMEEHTEKKKYHSESVSKLNALFISTTICGLIGTYFITIYIKKSNTISVFHYIYIGIFVVTEIIYIYSINKVKSYISDIIDIISSDKIITVYLEQTPFQDLRPTENNNELVNEIREIKDMCKRTMIKSFEIVNYVKWQSIHRKLAESWDSFNILGFELDDSTLATKTITVIIGFFMILNLNSALGLTIAT